MYLIDHSKVKNKARVIKSVSYYFLEKNFPLLAKEGNIYYFADTPLFREAVESSPVWIKVFVKFT